MDTCPNRSRRGFLRTTLAGMTLANGCSTSPQHPETGALFSRPIEGYTEESFAYEQQARTVFRSSVAGPPVLLMHELPGLTTETVQFADWLGAQGFHVVMPLLFGYALQDATIGTLATPLLCIRREFNCLRSGTASPITEWLRALCRHIHEQHDGPGIGVIGMCFTGGFVLSLMADESVIAPVSAQPALPFFSAAGIDADPAVLRRAAARAQRAPLLALRFSEDRVCRRERFAAIEHAFCSTEPCARFRPEVIPGKGHSTLTFDYQKALERGRDPRQRVLEHLKAQLA